MGDIYIYIFKPMLEMERKDSNYNYMRDIYTIQQIFQLKEHVIDKDNIRSFCSATRRRPKVHTDGWIDSENREDC